MLPLKAKLLSILLVCCMLKPFAQTSCVPVYVNEYASSGHMEPYTIKALADSTFLIAGRGTANGQGPYDGMVMHVDAKGTIIWSFLIGGAANDEFTGIAVLADSSFILSGSTASYGHPESKGWLVHINKNGNLIWSRQIGSTHTGTDRIKAVTQYSDKDIVGTFNEDDSSAKSNPVVFKIAEDGTMRWCTKFDNGKDDGFTSIAYSGDTIYASGYYSAGTAKKAVITLLKAINGALISARNIYNTVPYDQEIAGLEIFDHKISYGLWLHGPVNVQFPFNGTVYVQTDLAAAKQLMLFVDYSGNNGSVPRMTPFRSMDSGFYMLYSMNAVIGYASGVCKFNRFGKLDWGYRFSTLSAMANSALTVTADHGLASAHYYNNNLPGDLNQMRLVRTTKNGETADCSLFSIAMYTDTLGYNETAFSWSSVTAENPDQAVIVSVETVNSPTLQNLCLKNVCIDKTPLPPGCNKNYLIEYDAAQIVLFRDAISTPDGGRITVGDDGSDPDGLAIKTDGNGQPVWSKRFENFRHDMKFIRIIRSADNNYWIFGNEYITNQSLYIDLIKIDASGNMLTSVQLDPGNSVLPFSEVEDVVSTADGGFILAINNSLTFNTTYSYIIRCDANAAIIWQKEITHPGSQPSYKSISCSSDAVFLAYDQYDNHQYFGVERVDLKTGNLVWDKQFTNGNIERINRIFSIDDTTYTFVNEFTPKDLDSITHTIMLKVDPAGNLMESLLLKGETLTLGSWYPYYHTYQTPPTITMTSDNDFVLCGKALVNGVDKLNIARFDKKGKASWSRNYESNHSLSPENIHQQGTGFLILGETMIDIFGFASFANGFLLKVDGSGQIMNNATGNCQPVNRSFSASPGTVRETAVETRQANDITGTSWKPVHIISQDIDVFPTAYCTQKGSGGGAANLKQRGDACSDTLVFYLQDAAANDASATWQYDNQYFHMLFSNGDSLLLQPIRGGQSVIKATVEGNCFLDKQQISVSASRGASAVNLGRDTVLCTGKTIKLSAGSGFTSYLWNDGSTDSTLTVNAARTYYVQVTDLCGGKATDSIRIEVKDCAATLVFPNAFTPNHDGLNDVFRIKPPGNATDYNLQIFSRQGQKIFETSDPSAGWDGDFSGQLQAEGTYIWILRYTDGSGKKQNQQGSVVLIR